ncbi:MAG: peptidoglycan editing factor PgeF [Pleurocapsa sp.]
MVSNSAVYLARDFNSHWQWSTWEGLPYLTCSLLNNWQHGFFTQNFFPRIPEQLTLVLNPHGTVHRVRQVHGNRVLTPQEIELSRQFSPDKSLVEGDGMISDATAQGVWVASADCNPILIGDVTTGRVSAIHAGWRGTAKKIVPSAIASLLKSGSNLADLRIAIGPAIAGEVYQVDAAVAVEVGSTIITNAKTKTTTTIVEELQQLPNSPILEDAAPDKVRLDVRRVNQIQLEQLGISPAQIAIAPYCTYQHSDRFFSYRRTKEKKVQWSGIVSK